MSFILPHQFISVSYSSLPRLLKTFLFCSLFLSRGLTLLLRCYDSSFFLVIYFTSLYIRLLIMAFVSSSSSRTLLDRRSGRKELLEDDAESSINLNGLEIPNLNSCNSFDFMNENLLED